MLTMKGPWNIFRSDPLKVNHMSEENVSSVYFSITRRQRSTWRSGRRNRLFPHGLLWGKSVRENFLQMRNSVRTDMARHASHDGRHGYRQQSVPPATQLHLQRTALPPTPDEDGGRPPEEQLCRSFAPAATARRRGEEEQHSVRVRRATALKWEVANNSALFCQ